MVLEGGLRDGEQEAHAFVGAILTNRKACYREWKARLANEPRWMERALEIFAAFQYPGAARRWQQGGSPAIFEGRPAPPRLGLNGHVSR